MELRFCSVVLIAGLAVAAVPAKKTVTTTTAKKGSKRVPVKVSKSTGRANGKAAPKAAWGPPRQASPTQDRYREIQESLAAKGYLQGPATGVWDQNSIDAMKKFQADQKLEPTGKLTSRSLIQLGLGPKDESGSK
jgi:peptidoglycan hydrolase-like protein with peptidoglycan-binding domain